MLLFQSFIIRCSKLIIKIPVDYEQKITQE